MAFKTDQLKLKETYANDTAAGAPVNGTLALIGATGSKILKVRDNGSWTSIESAHTAVVSTITADVAIPTNSIVKIVVTGNPGIYKFTLAAATATNNWANNSVIELINLSDYIQTVTRHSGSASSTWFLTNTGSTSTSGDLEINKGQRVLIMPHDVSGTPKHNIAILTA